MVGDCLTFIENVFVATQPLSLVPLIVNVVSFVTVTFKYSSVETKLLSGFLHSYTKFPMVEFSFFAVRSISLLKQAIVSPVMLNLGVGLIVMAADLLFSQPFASIPHTVISVFCPFSLYSNVSLEVPSSG